MALEDKEVKQADFLSSTLPMPLPKVAKPRTTNDPEAQEIWPMTLQEAIRIGLDNSEVVRVISLGAQGIPVGGFEPTPLNTGAGGRRRQRARCRRACQTVYDPAIQETQIAQALSAFDTAFTTSLLWGKNTRRSTTPSRPVRWLAGPRTPVISIQDTAQFQVGLPEADGDRCPARRRAQHQLALPEQPYQRHPVGLHDEHPDDADPALAGQRSAAGPAGRRRPVGPGGEPGPDRHRPAQRRRRGLAVQGRGHGPRPLDRAAILEPGPAARPALEQREGGRARRGDRQARAGRAGGRARAPWPTSPRPSSGSSSSASTW